jgi:hypothetical protein
MQNESYENTTGNSEPEAEDLPATPNVQQPELMESGADDQNARKLHLSNGLFVWVDVGDFNWLSNYKWGYNWFENNNGYARRWGMDAFGRITNILMHREIISCPLGLQVDHINHNTLDNRRSNLRIVVKHQNMANARKTLHPRSSKYKGVTWYKAYGKWTSNIMRNGVRYHLGYFNSEDEAAMAYNQKAIEVSAEYSELNTIGH